MLRIVQISSVQGVREGTDSLRSAFKMRQSDLLASLPDDFMASGREGPPTRTRDTVMVSTPPKRFLLDTHISPSPSWRTSAARQKRGEPIGNNDQWLAAHALTEGWTLVTHNTREFVPVPGLTIENWVG